MKLKLLYIHPQNYGNMMMADSFMLYFDEILHRLSNEKVEFYLDVNDEKELEIVKRNLPKGINVYSDILYNQKRRGIWGKIEKLIFVPVEILHTIKQFDACIVLGGDCISEYYSKQKFFFNMIKFRFISKRIPLVALGQTMGPFSTSGTKLVCWALKHTTIFTRDDDCSNYLKSRIKLQTVNTARDLALLDIPFQNEKETICKVLKKYIGGEQEYVTYVPSGANLQYTSDTEHYVEEYALMIINTIKKYSVDVLLLAHVIHTSTSDDSKIIRMIMEKIPQELLERIHCINHPILPYEARILIGNGKYTITGRMHAAVSSINMGIVPICLSYSVKYKGVIGDPFHLNEYIIQCRGNENWYGNRISCEVDRLQEKLGKEIDVVTLRIEEERKINRIMAYSQIEETAQLLFERKNTIGNSNEDK